MIVYGDIHGCLDELIALRQKIGVEENDTEICTGDLINKGEQSKQTLEYIYEKGIGSVMGNHEEKLLHHLYPKDFKGSFYTPPPLTKQEKHLVEELPEHLIEFLNSLPYFVQYGRYTIVHGGITDEMELDNLTPEDRAQMVKMKFLHYDDPSMLLGKGNDDSVFWAEHYSGKDGFVIFGHKRSEEVIEYEHCLGIDTGCVYGGKLTAVVIDDPRKLDHEIIQYP